MWLALGEALLNLGLSVGLVLYFRTVVCVALGSLLSTFLFGWVLLWPWAAREAQLSGWKLARLVLVPTWLACLPLLALMIFERMLPILDFGDSLVWLGFEGGVALLMAAWGVWRLALTHLERDQVAAFVSRSLGRRRPA